MLCLPGDDLVVLEDKLDYFGIVKGRVFALHSPGQEVVPAGQDRAREVQLAQDGVVKEKEADLVSLALVGRENGGAEIFYQMMVPERLTSGPARRLVSEAKRFATEAAWQVVNDCIQVLGGIGYTTVYPLERYLRDCRLALIWTGTSEVMNLIIQHEHFLQAEAARGKMREVEGDAPEADQAEEKVYGEAQETLKP